MINQQCRRWLAAEIPDEYERDIKGGIHTMDVYCSVCWTKKLFRAMILIVASKSELSH